jgi:cellulose synthase/poly-beta-1,6-N-acetylglucosamine synthase-like glycosyltransferase
MKYLFWSCLFLVLYTYCLYPLLLAVLCRFKSARRAEDLPAMESARGRDRSASDADLPAVTMLVAAHNEERVIREKIANSLAIDYPADRFRVVIASDGSQDATNSLVAACDDPRIQLIAYRRRRGKIATLNATIPQIADEILVMSDANTMYAPDAVRALVCHFRDPAVGCVCGELILESANGAASGEGLYWRYETWLKGMESRLGFLLGATGGIYALRRTLFRPLPNGTIVEDFVTAMKVLDGGHRVCYEPAARATETTAPSMQEEMRRKCRIGAGGFQAIALTLGLLNPLRGLPALGYWSHKIVRWCVPFFLLGMLVGSFGLIGETFYRFVLGAQLLAYGIGIQGLLPRPIDHPLLRPARYFFVMNLALLIGFIRFVRGTQRVTWEQARRS